VLTGLKKPLSRRHSRRALHGGAVFSTEDAMEGPRAFAEKRPRNGRALTWISRSTTTPSSCGEALRKFLKREVLPLEEKH